MKPKLKLKKNRTALRLRTVQRQFVGSGEKVAVYYMTQDDAKDGPRIEAIIGSEPSWVFPQELPEIPIGLKNKKIIEMPIPAYRSDLKDSMAYMTTTLEDLFEKLQQEDCIILKVPVVFKSSKVGAVFEALRQKGMALHLKRYAYLTKAMDEKKSKDGVVVSKVERVKDPSVAGTESADYIQFVKDIFREAQNKIEGQARDTFIEEAFKEHGAFYFTSKRMDDIHQEERRKVISIRTSGIKKPHKTSRMMHKWAYKEYKKIGDEYPHWDMKQKLEELKTRFDTELDYHNESNDKWAGVSEHTLKKWAHTLPR